MSDTTGRTLRRMAEVSAGIGEGRQVVCDLDGTLAVYDGWRGFGSIGDPIDHAADLCRALADMRCRVLIDTCRLTTARRYGQAQYNAALDTIDQWLERHGFPSSIEVYTGHGKPIAAAYVDDRGVSARRRPTQILGEIIGLLDEVPPNEGEGGR